MFIQHLLDDNYNLARNRKQGVIKRALSNNRAGLHKELGLVFLPLLVFLYSCAAVQSLDVQQKLEKYNCYWDCPNESGENGWCCEHAVPEEDHYIFDCKNAKERKIVQ